MQTKTADLLKYQNIINQQNNTREKLKTTTARSQVLDAINASHAQHLSAVTQAISPNIPTILPTMTNVTTSDFGEYLSISQKEKIPFYTGYLDEDIRVQDWFTEAESIATSCNWTKEQMKRNFSQRFKHLALALQQDLDRSQRNLSYDEWKDIIIKEFKDPAENEYFKQDLSEIKQKEKERVRDFKARIEKTFIKGYGEDAFKSTEPITASIRDDILKTALQNGLKASLEPGYWNKIEPTHKYEDAVRIATTVESVLGKRKMSQSTSKARDSTISAISLHQEILTSDIESLKRQFEGMKSSFSESRKTDDGASISAIASNNSGNSVGYTRFSKDTGTPNLSVNAKAVRFPQDTRNIERGRPNDRSSPYNRERPTSPYNRERSTSPYNRERYNSSPYRQDRPLNRSLSRERSPSIDRSSRDLSLSRERPHHNDLSQNFRTTRGSYRNPAIHHYQTPSHTQHNLRNPPNQSNRNSPTRPNNTLSPRPPYDNPPNQYRSSRNTVTCFRCGLRGHIRTECRVSLSRDRRSPN